MTRYYVDIDSDTPERLEIEWVASPSDLAYPLANALITIEKGGSPTPPYKAHANEDGKVRDLTTAEQKAFTTALEHALDHVRSDKGGTI